MAYHLAPARVDLAGSRWSGSGVSLTMAGIKPRPDPADSAVGPAATVAELEEGLRQLHRMEMQTKLTLERVEAQVAAAIKVLHRAEFVNEQVVEAEADVQRMRIYEKRQSDAQVQLGPDVDKHTVATSPVDCATLLPPCKARCCRLTVALDFKDIEDGLRSEYARPYLLKRDRATGYCVYSEATTHACSAYDVRPSIGRTYDRRNDARVWADFEARKPAPWRDDVDPAPPLVQTRLPTSPAR